MDFGRHGVQVRARGRQADLFCSKFVLTLRLDGFSSDFPIEIQVLSNFSEKTYSIKIVDLFSDFWHVAEISGLTLKFRQKLANCKQDSR